MSQDSSVGESQTVELVDSVHSHRTAVDDNILAVVAGVTGDDGGGVGEHGRQLRVERGSECRTQQCRQQKARGQRGTRLGHRESRLMLHGFALIGMAYYDTL